MLWLFPKTRSRALFYTCLRTWVNPNKGWNSGAYLKKVRTYKVTDSTLKDPAEDKPEYIPPENLWKPPKEDMIRASIPEIDSKKLLKIEGVNYDDFTLPQSYYFAVRHNNMTFHVFDASRISVGRMAIRAAKYLMGKHKPNYDPKKTLENGDRIIVVNGGNIKVTGKKRIQWIFRHHTQYAGGLKEIVFEDLMKKDWEQLIKRVIRGMLPFNRTRKFLLERIIVHRGQYHPHLSQGIPQFLNQPLPDPNILYGLPNYKEGYSLDQPHEVMNRRAKGLNDMKIIYESDPASSPEELKHIRKEYNEDMLNSTQYKKFLESQGKKNEKQK